jgi:hypothetical protein
LSVSGILNADDEAGWKNAFSTRWGNPAIGLLNTHENALIQIDEAAHRIFK